MNLIKRSPESLEALLCRDRRADYLGLPTYLVGLTTCSNARTIVLKHFSIRCGSAAGIVPQRLTKDLFPIRGT